VTVRAADFAYEAPARIPAGMTTFRLANDGPNFHHMQIVRLDGAKTFADLQQALRKPGPLPGWAVVVGGPNAPDPKTEANATLDMRPGRYALVCFVDVPGGVPHLAKGMIKELTVTPAAGGATVAAAPAPDVVLTLRDYQFDLSKPLARGRQTIEVRTAANTQPHEVELIRLAPGKTAEQMLAWLGKPEGPPPGRARGRGCHRTGVDELLHRGADAGQLPADLLPPRREGRQAALHARDDADGDGELSERPAARRSTRGRRAGWQHARVARVSLVCGMDVPVLILSARGSEGRQAAGVPPGSPSPGYEHRLPSATLDPRRRRPPRAESAQPLNPRYTDPVAAAYASHFDGIVAGRRAVPGPRAHPPLRRLPARPPTGGEQPARVPR
jgi:hypothetical protein